jgi:hypothetical protein
MGTHSSEIECHVTNIGRHPIVLGMSWLKKHNPQINWKNRTIAYTSEFCSKNCLEVPSTLQIAAETTLPEEYKEFADVFDESRLEELPPHRPTDITLDLLPEAKLKHGPIYKTSPAEDKEMKKVLETLI